MILKPITKTFDLGDGRSISIETGRLARQADGAVVVRMGDTMLLATVVSAKEPKESAAFFPLTVDYQEKFAAAGRIPGGFLKREGRLSDNEILISRLVDRAIRPLFPDGYYNETQIIISLISSDEKVAPDALAALAASAAISVSDLPFEKPVSETRVARIDGKFVVNPYREDLEKADLDIIVGATEDSVCMVEGEMAECSEESLIEAIHIGHEAIKVQCQAQNELAEMVGIKEKRVFEPPVEDEELKKKIEDGYRDKIYKVARAGTEKHERKEGFSKIREEFLETYSEEELEELDTDKVDQYFHDLEKDVIRKMVLEEKVRLDGRKLEEIRPLYMETDFLPAAHGSAIFTRGETQSLTTVTMGTKLDQQMLDYATYTGYSKFILHYNFPPFSTGEAKFLRGPSRREIGHGNLAMRSVKGVMPNMDEYPYTVRVVSDILESNGSSSMATVCASSMALMDAGVQLKSHVSGIAMGLISDEETGEAAVLTDILGDEDHLGDMDFKVTGTRKGICACQMDIKMRGLSSELLTKALNQAKDARLSLLDEMEKVISDPRPEFKPHVPRIEKMIIDSEFIGAIIGPGGKIIQEIQKETDTIITIDEVDNKGEVLIAGDNKEKIDAAVDRIKNIIAVPEVGEEYEGVVKSIMPYGAFIEFLPGKQGLLHISEISWSRIEKLEEVMKEGDVVRIKLLDIDQKSGKYRLSRKVLLPKQPKETVKE